MQAWIYAALLAWPLAMPVHSAASTPPQPEQIMAVPPALQAQFAQQVIAVGGSDRARLERLVNFLFQPAGLGMTYSDAATLTVAEAYHTRQANCLTFTLLTVALAREAGLQAYAQELDGVVAWRMGDNIVFRFNHVNAGIAIGHSHLTVDVARDAVLARSPPRRVSDQQMLALYYNNRAAELLVSATPATAEPYMTLALQLAPRYAGAWSNAGVVRLRQGNPHAAERDYLRALALEPEHSGALFNLVALYRGLGDEVQRASYARRLEKVQEKNPYFQYLQAEDAARHGDYAGAVTRYRRAIRQYDGDARFYVGLSQAYRQLGEERLAARASRRALALSSNGSGNTRH